ncbi:MAG TPA: diaminopropionate ammonia-lyase [Streptosporangiaceae bacterium]|jgi:diaminopropionate ammonia-lyase
MTRPDPAGTWYSRPAARHWRCARPPESALGFHAGLPGYRRTPLVEQPALAAELGVGRVLVKDESSRLGLPAFKMLGASWAVARLLARRGGLTGSPTLEQLRHASAGRPLRLVAATDGNHGRAVARMAKMLGADARIFVPWAVPDPAVAAIAGEGATVTRVDGPYDLAVQHAAAFAGARPEAELIQDMAWPGYQEVPRWIADGYATMLHEIDAQLAALAGPTVPGLIVVPAGVGSLAQAVVAHCRSGPLASDAVTATAVLSVEPDGAACVLASLLAGELRTVPTAGTNMTGLNCGTPSAAAWPYLLAGLDAAVSVSDAAAAEAVADLARLGMSSGPCGAATLAGARAALTGTGSPARRAGLGIDATSVVVLLSTEGGAAAHASSRP